MNHSRNMTNRLEYIQDLNKRQITDKETGKVMNFPDSFDEEMKVFIDNLRKYILNSKWYNENKQ